MGNKNIKHTPGPWGVKGWRVTIPGTGEVTLAAPGVTTATADANARLISAAPELLAALEELHADLDFRKALPIKRGIFDRIKDAIAKAKGE
jgi:aminoglycoside phosphotransferase